MSRGETHGLLPPSYTTTFHQILYSEKFNHWSVVYFKDTTQRNSIDLFDSRRDFDLTELPEQIASLLRTPAEFLTINKKWCPEEENSDVSGVHAIANLTELILQPESYLTNSWKWPEEELCGHIIRCFETNFLSCFPKTAIPLSKIQNSNEESFEFEVYCHCRQPDFERSYYKSRKKIQWVKCRNVQCRRWFHLYCAKLLEDNFQNINQDWRCLVCEEKRCMYL